MQSPPPPPGGERGEKGGGGFFCQKMDGALDGAFELYLINFCLLGLLTPAASVELISAAWAAWEAHIISTHFSKTHFLKSVWI